MEKFEQTVNLQTLNQENLHEDIYGKSFALYELNDMAEFVSFFQRRFQANGLSPVELFSGKKCLDAGCGNGRGSIFMASHGAASVTLVDISPTNIVSSAKNMNKFGFTNFNCNLNNLDNLPFEDESFDFVWCNGVLMHTHNPDKCLAELSRVLKVAGKAWIYVYGCGGIYWYCVQRIRSMVKDISPDDCIHSLRLIGYSTRYVAEYLDDWKVPYLRTYSDTDFGKRLEELGFAREKPIRYGVSYDTNHRRSLYPEDATWIGEGDLRYLLEKTHRVTSRPQISPISANEHGSEYVFPDQLISKFAPLFDRLEQATARMSRDRRLLTLASCSHIQFELRKILSEERAFPVSEFASIIDETCKLVEMLATELV